MIPFPEYPRPQFERKDDYLILNGKWNYEIHDKNDKIIKKGDILVPYSPESKLSGVEHILFPDETLIYERSVEFPYPFDEEKEELVLHFGAVDYLARVIIDGKDYVEHEGGYLPFSTTIHKPSFKLCVIVKDPTDTSEGERGKQKIKRGGIWYTPQSGIWQTVWLEKVKKEHITDLKIVPDLKGFSIMMNTTSGGKGILTIEGRTIGIESGEEKYIAVKDPKLWSPEEPNLYHFTLSYMEDRVETYTALRTFGVKEDEKGVKKLFLNGKPYFHHGVLDQGYWEDGLYTPPGEKAMEDDLLLLKLMGFNTVRKHIKIEPLRWYSLCDRLGLIVWQDMPSGGGKYSPLIVSTPLIIGSHIKDNHYRLLSRKDEEMREKFKKNLTSMVEHLFNVPSIAMWVVFNEGWGQFDSVEISGMIEKMDRTRSVDYHSGWLDQKKGQFKSQHVYFRPYRYKEDKKKRCVILSEFGGYGLRIEGHTFSEKSFTYRGYKTKEELTCAVVALYEREIIPAKEKGLSASIYTQLSDVEDELNGLVTYDREVVKLDIDKMKKMSEKLVKH